MRSVVLSEFISLDGVIQEPAWTVPYWNAEIAGFKFDELFASDALLLGRVTYQGFAAAWPTQTDEQGYADRMNGLPKFVASQTLEVLEWNNSHLIQGDLAEEIAKLKQQAGKNILIFGSATAVQSLLRDNLIDRFWLFVNPVSLGKGLSFFNGIKKILYLKLISSKAFASGVVCLHYEK